MEFFLVNMWFFRKGAKGKIFENLGKTVQHLKKGNWLSVSHYSNNKLLEKALLDLFYEVSFSWG